VPDPGRPPPDAPPSPGPDGTDPRRARLGPLTPQEEGRLARLPVPEYPDDLPVAQRREDLLAAIDAHQVVVVAGETGSGKSTQLPKLCLELGRGVRGLIGHTQPRRIAARSIAERVAAELGTEVGGTVGYAVRFTDRVGDDTFVKLMTDGILLAEVQRDRLLRRYDTIIVDEAHERSLNIDFLLGYLRRLLPRRPDLKVIITSATIDTERFAEHFGGAPVVEVSGRTYPVELRYRPLEDPEAGDARDQAQGIADAVEELRRAGPGDVLVFCSGEREIRDAADALRGLRLPDTEILPLYARLSSAEQHRVFQPHPGRRIVLATNVAETSLTVPGIRYVVDPGTARISRFNTRTKVQRLPIEPVSQASANQRAGRCGRLGPGICVRLYSEEDFAARPEFTDPEIQRTSLASVILQMAALGLGEVASFPFVDPPDGRAIRDGVVLLAELGAIDPDREGTRRWITPLGRRLAQLPVDPRLGRMVLEADANGCLHEVMVIAAGLSIQDPRERPTGKEQAADALHARFAHPDSDFLAYLRLWDHLHEARRDRSSNQFRTLCRDEHLNVLRVREWQDVYAQLRQVAQRMGLRRNAAPADPDVVHLSVLAGLLTQVGMRDPRTGEYRGARNARFAIAPGSSLFRKGPRWVMVAELVETNRMWGRVAARILPEWIERVGPHLVQRTHEEAWWDRDRGAAMTNERVTIHGLPLVAQRPVHLATVDPAAARELLIQHALVAGEWDTHHRFAATNRERFDQVRVLEARVRRDLLVDDDAIAVFFDSRIPPEIVSVRHLDRWWRRHRDTDPHLLDLPLEVLLGRAGAGIDPADYPDEWRHGDLVLPLTYTFDPDSRFDGVAVALPVAALNQLDARRFEWGVPGWRAEVVAHLVRSLPKSVRRALVPVPDTVAWLLERLDPASGGLRDALARALSRRAGTAVAPDDLDLTVLPDHLRPTFEIVDDDGRVLAVGKDLDALRALLREQVRTSLAGAQPDMARTGLSTFPGDPIPQVVETDAPGHRVRAYPALVDEGRTVGLRLLATRGEQAEAHWAGTRRLLQLALPAATRALGRLLTNEARLALAVSPYRSEAEWVDDCFTCALDHLLDAAGGPVWDPDGFAELHAAVRVGLPDVLSTVGPVAVDILRSVGRIERTLASLDAPGLAISVTDVRSHLGRLVYPGMLAGVGTERIADVARYLRAVERRLDVLPGDPVRDQERIVRCRRLEREYDELIAARPPSPELDEVAWLLEEYRVSVFAQAVGTAVPVSEKRILTALAAAGRR